MKKINSIVLLLAAVLLFSASQIQAANYKALIVTGQSNHNWEGSCPILKQILIQTNLFTVDVATTPAKGGDMSAFQPDFKKYNIVVVDYNGE